MLFRHTLSINATPIYTACKHTRSQYTFIGIGTFGVIVTADIVMSNRLTTSLTVRDRIRWTSAHNRTDRRCVEHCTSLL